MMALGNSANARSRGMSNDMMELSTTTGPTKPRDGLWGMACLAVAICIISGGLVIYHVLDQTNTHNWAAAVIATQVESLDTDHRTITQLTRNERAMLTVYFVAMRSADIGGEVTITASAWSKLLLTLEELDRRTGFVPQYMAVTQLVAYEGLEAIAEGAPPATVVTHYVNWLQ